MARIDGLSIFARSVFPSRNFGLTEPVKELVRVGAAFAVNCVASLETGLAAAEAAGNRDAVILG